MIKLNVIKETDKEIEIQLSEDKPTLFILIKEELDKMDNVVFSAWKEEHPLTKNIKLKVITNGKVKARDAIIKAIDNAIRRLNEFEKIIDNIKW